MELIIIMSLFQDTEVHIIPAWNILQQPAFAMICKALWAGPSASLLEMATFKTTKQTPKSMLFPQ